MKIDLKKKISFFVVGFFIIMGSIIFGIVFIHNNLVRNYKIKINNFINKQIRYFGYSVLDYIYSFEDDLKYLFLGKDIESFLQDETLTQNNYESFRRFFEKYEDLVEELVFYNEDLAARSFYKDKHNYYVLGDLEYGRHNCIFKEKPEVYNINFKITYILPIADENGKVVLNLLAKLNLSKFIRRELKQYYIIKPAWNWFLHLESEKTEIFYTEEGFLPPKTFFVSDLNHISEELNQGIEGSFEHSIIYRNKITDVFSHYFPLKIFGDTYGLLISLPTSGITSLIDIPFKYLSLVYFIAFILFGMMFLFIVRIMKSTNKTLSDSEYLINIILDNLPVGIAIINENKIISKANKELFKIFGYGSDKKIVNRHCNESIYSNPENRDDWADDKEKRRNIKKILRRDDGSRIPVVKSSEFIDFKDINLEVETFFDITDEENALRQLKLAYKTKENFLANISHEIRTPLNGIIGLADLLENENLTPLQRDYVKYIVSGSRRLMSIIEDILTFSELESGKSSVSADEIDIFSLVKPLINKYAIKAEEKSIDFEVRISPAITYCFLSDKNKLFKLLDVLLSNAVKFTSRGAVFLNVIPLENTSDEKKAELKFEISDTGIGIAENKINLIFDSFMQGDSGKNRKFSGTGLGLAIAKALSKDLNTEIKVESEEGKGSLFSFVAEVELTGKKANCNLLSSGKLPVKSKKLIIVGSKENKFDFSFSDENIEIKIYDSGLEIINFLNSFSSKTDFLIMDKDLYDMDGIEVYDIIGTQIDCDKMETVIHNAGDNDIETKERTVVYKDKKSVDWIKRFIVENI